MKLKNSFIFLIIFIFLQCETFFKSSVSIVYTTGTIVLLASASVSASIDSLSKSISYSSYTLLNENPPPSKKEYGIESDDSTTYYKKPKPKEFWTKDELNFVKDVAIVSKFYLSQSPVESIEEWKDDLSQLGKKHGQIVSHSTGLSYVGIGYSLALLKIPEYQFKEIISLLSFTGDYEISSLIYGYNLTNI